MSINQLLISTSLKNRTNLKNHSSKRNLQKSSKIYYYRARSYSRIYSVGLNTGTKGHFDSKTY